VMAGVVRTGVGVMEVLPPQAERRHAHKNEMERVAANATPSLLIKRLPQCRRRPKIFQQAALLHWLIHQAIHQYRQSGTNCQQQLTELRRIGLAMRSARAHNLDCA
jgi:hypothetical protein